MNKNSLSRRAMLGVSAAGLASVFVGYAGAQEQRRQEGTRQRAGQPGQQRPLPTFENAAFYTDGKFDEEKARDAIIQLARYHRYPIFPGFREKIWVSDYGLGEFTAVGLAAVGFVNHVAGEYSYMMQDLFLLPNQMLPEHWHVKPEKTPNCPQKDEGWLIRYGRSYVIGEGEPNLPPDVVVPKIHWDGKVTVKHCTVADPGVFVPLIRVESRHWQFAGKEGVILTEVANAHDNASVRHSDPTANETFLKGV
ncbi:MAG: hypothetical protein LBJ67_03435 [Planctomycetaceae bacterium]|jgi:D-lyxose ketol-isomerase|nr:hypothetical protein [Planctomycetaceae bacterium]